MLSLTQFSIGSLLRNFWRPIAVTWFLVVLENVLMAFIPLLIGLAIDDLLAGEHRHLINLAAVMLGLTVIGVGRRFYDTRAYGSIRVGLGALLCRRQGELPVSARTARLDMSRELVDFLEQEVPQLMTSMVQIIVSIALLAFFNWALALAAVLLMLGLLLIYSLFHPHFYRFNAGLNAQAEHQVLTLQLGKPLALMNHLKALRAWEVKLSDAEALLFGFIFILVTGFISFNLWWSASLDAVSPGTLFSIISYSWEFVEALLVLPVALQSLSRLSDISERINRNQHVDESIEAKAGC